MGTCGRGAVAATGHELPAAGGQPKRGSRAYAVAYGVLDWRSEHLHGGDHQYRDGDRALAARLRHVERTVERLMDPPVDQLKKLTTALYRLLVHSDVKSILGRLDPLVVEVDRSLSRVQWEMLPSMEPTYDCKPLGVAPRRSAVAHGIQPAS